MLYGSVIYILILLIFDSLYQIKENFFSQEIFVTIILTYVQFEAIRGINLLINRKSNSRQTNLSRIFTQFISGATASILIVSLGIWAYFVFIVGFSTFTSELITFIAIFLLTSIIYNLLYISLIFLGMKNEVKIDKESTLRKNLEADLQSYKNEINPGLLFESFESLIGLIHSSTLKADEFIGHLSAYYRYCLHNRNNDLITLSEEMKVFRSLLTILNCKYSGQITLINKLPDDDIQNMLIPCTLLRLLELATRTNIIDPNQKMDIELTANNSHILFEHKHNPTLHQNEDIISHVEKMKKSYSYFSTVAFEYKENNGIKTAKIPLLKLEDAEAEE